MSGIGNCECTLFLSAITTNLQNLEGEQIMRTYLATSSQFTKWPQKNFIHPMGASFIRASFLETTPHASIISFNRLHNNQRMINNN